MALKPFLYGYHKKVQHIKGKVYHKKRMSRYYTRDLLNLKITSLIRLLNHWQIRSTGNKNPIFLKNRSVGFSNVEFFMSHSLEFIISILSWSIPQKDEIHTLHVKYMKNITWKTISVNNIIIGINYNRAK